MGKFSLIAIFLSILIIGGSLSAKYYNNLREDVLLDMSIKKHNYKSLENSYFLDQEILKGNDVSNTIIVFMANKSNYYSAQRSLDNKKYDDAIVFLKKINLSSFDTLKNDLLGDVYYYQGEKIKARKSYEDALKTVSKDNAYLKEAIFSKYQTSFQ